ncbi:MAG: phosphoenolpyruvate carboxylase [Vicinamibacterales bacterium]
MGGDRDGNPNVTAEVTWRACLMARWVAARLYSSEVEALRGELSMDQITRRMLDAASDPEMRGATSDDVTRAAPKAGSWTTWSEDERRRFVLPYIDPPGPRLPLDGDSSEVARDVIDTFRALPLIARDSLGAYVITMAGAVSDVLAVLALQRAAGLASPLRIVPLFETARDLELAGHVLEELLAVEQYRAFIGGRQEVMVGYSDSAKEVGRLAASWLLYRAQEDLVRAAKRAGVRLTIFHGRGGSVGRGGGPTHLVIRALPPGAVDGSLRVTEQGEVVQVHYGLPDLAVRTLEVYTTATLEATLRPAPAPDGAWRERVDHLSNVAREACRGVVFVHPRFVEYFRSATPEPEIGQPNIGCRPARRRPGSGVEDLRAIPWQFAWTQTRLLLASWLGLEEALRPPSVARAAAGAAPSEVAGGAAGVASAAVTEFREMYRRWPYFQALLDLMAMVLAKADERIAAEFDRGLVPPDLQPLGADLRRRLELARERLLAATGHGDLLDGNRVLKRSIAVRNPHVDPINLLQVELLRRLRTASASGHAPDALLWTAFVVTVNGIAAGMRNTG